MADNNRIYSTPRGAKIDLDKVEEWASRGLSIENMAALCGIERSTLYNLKESNPQFGQEFELAVESGKAMAIEAVANKLLELCLEGHPQSIQYFLERKGGFGKVDTVENKHSGHSGGPIEHAVNIAVTFHDPER